MVLIDIFKDNMTVVLISNHHLTLPFRTAHLNSFKKNISNYQSLKRKCLIDLIITIKMLVEIHQGICFSIFIIYFIKVPVNNKFKTLFC